jgi:hypothetical protein
VEAEIRPENMPFQPVGRFQRGMMTAVLEGGPFDSREIDLERVAIVYQTTVPTEDEGEPFVFDPEAFRNGKRNIVRGEFDTLTYLRTNRRTEDGLVIFSCLPESAPSEPATSA